MARMTNKKWVKKIFILELAGLIILYNLHEQNITSIQKKDLEKAKAVTVLPAGTQEAWDLYIAHRIASILQRNGSTVRLLDYEGKSDSETIFMSITSSYKISCDYESSIEFPQYNVALEYDEGRIDIPITQYIYKRKYDSASKVDVYINPDSSGEQPPPFGVNEESIAAKELRTHICQLITDKIQTVFSPNN